MIQAAERGRQSVFYEERIRCLWPQQRQNLFESRLHRPQPLYGYRIRLSTVFMKVHG